MTVLNLTKNSKRNSQLRGFTLVEMLTVMGIAAILGAILLPALQGLQKGGGFTSSVYNVSDMMNLARTFAVANDTYVYVGFEEVNRSQSTSATPQTTGVGRVAICIVATNDGTNNTATSNLAVVRPVQVFDFLHVAVAGFSNPSTGNMARPDGASPSILASFYNSTAPFYYPLSASSSATAKYAFNNVICYNPQGGVVNLANTSAVQWAELDLQPVSGTATPAAPSNVNAGNQAALVIEGATGATTVYRP